MTPEDFKKLIKNFTEEDVTSDEPHVSMRCEENDIDVNFVKNMLVSLNRVSTRIVEDRHKVYKVYYRLSRHVELKIIVDLFEYNKMNIRTVKRINDIFRIRFIRKRRF